MTTYFKNIKSLKMPVSRKRPTFEELQKFFYKPLNVAAKKLGIGRTLLKQICRQYGIKRWPYRKVGFEISKEKMKHTKLEIHEPIIIPRYEDNTTTENLQNQVQEVCLILPPILDQPQKMVKLPSIKQLLEEFPFQTNLNQ
eukprot:gene12318-5992_t